MEAIKCLVNQKTLLDACIIGLITFIIGAIGLNVSDPDENNNKKRNKIYIIMFITGFLIHFISEIVGINKWYCDKKCFI